MFRAGMPLQHVDCQRGLARVADRDAELDVFCLLKLNMADTSLCQAPTVVWPGSAASRQRASAFFSEKPAVLYSQLDGERKNELALLVKAMRENYPQLSRAARYYKALSQDSTRRQEPADLSFFRDGPTCAARQQQLELPARMPPAKPHQLKVVFRQGA